MKNKKPKSKINKWKLTAIISLVVNGIVALLLTIGLATPRSYVKASADFEYSYDASKIITNLNQVDTSLDYKLYYNWEQTKINSLTYAFPYFQSNYSLEKWNTLFDFNLDNTEYVVYFEISENSFSFFTEYRSSGGSWNDAYFASLDSSHPDRIVFDRTLLPSNFYDTFFSKFDGSLSIGINRNGNAFKFLASYFSQYSVQNIQLSLKTGGYQLVRSIDFQSSFSFLNTMHQNYNFINNNLIRSTGRLFNSNPNNDMGYMFCLSGMLDIKGNYNGLAHGLCFVWKPFNLLDYYFVSMDDFAVDASVANQNNTFYYYLDSICPYGSYGDNIIEPYSWVYDDMPLVYLYNSVINSEVTLGETKNRLKMTSDIAFTSNTFTILKLNMYPHSFTYNSWVYNLNQTPSLNWNTMSYLFKPINHFYFNNGSPVITEPSSNDIENSTNNITGVFALISGAFESLIPLLSIMVLPNITLGVLIFIPLILTIIIVVIKLVKR